MLPLGISGRGVVGCGTCDVGGLIAAKGTELSAGTAPVSDKAMSKDVIPGLVQSSRLLVLLTASVGAIQSCP